MSEELEYPFNVFPTDLIRRVLAHVPPAHSDEKVAEINAYRAEAWADEQLDPTPYPVTITFGVLFDKVTKDPFTVFMNRDEVRDAVEWHLGKGYLVKVADDEYRMTEAGLEALRA